jgi:hypothetical protein
MKTKFYWLTLIVSAGLISQAYGDHHSNSGEQSSSTSSSRATRGGPASSYRSMPMRSFSGSRGIYSGQHFSPVGVRSQVSTNFRQYRPSLIESTSTRRFTGETFERGNRLTQFSNGNNQVRANPGRAGLGASQVRNGNNLPANWRNHVVAQHSATWHRDWDRSRDHWWHGHRCHFFGGSWVIFDFGFYPWPYWYPYDYYGYGYDPYGYSGYPYGYDSGYSNSDAYPGQEYYGQNGNESPSEGPGSAVSAAQERLARDGYYHGRIDGVAGPGTRGAIARFQSDHGLHVTGTLTPDTLQTLGLGRVANY